MDESMQSSLIQAVPMLAQDQKDSQTPIKLLNM